MCTNIKLLKFFLAFATIGLLVLLRAPQAETQGLFDSPIGAGARVYLPLAYRSTAPTPMPTPAPTPTPTEIPVVEDWLALTNFYRAMAQLPPVIENTTLSTGCWLHARYIVKNNILLHWEEYENPWFTLEGAMAAQSSNILACSSESIPFDQAFNAWMAGPFHALGILDPRLQQTGYGSYRESGSGYKMAAVLDIARGRRELPSNITFPILWPGPKTSVPLRMHWNETPSPLTSCPGYAAPVGLPVIVQMGPGNRTPRVTAHTFSHDGVPLEHCVFDEMSYTNPDESQQELIRMALDARDAIVLVPRAPLEPGASYTVSITVDYQTYTWSFAVTADAS
jgi:uncharacterized protein YkwD